MPSARADCFKCMAYLESSLWGQHYLHLTQEKEKLRSYVTFPRATKQAKRMTGINYLLQEFLLYLKMISMCYRYLSVAALQTTPQFSGSEQWTFTFLLGHQFWSGGPGNLHGDHQDSKALHSMNPRKEDGWRPGHVGDHWLHNMYTDPPYSSFFKA